MTTMVVKVVVVDKTYLRISGLQQIFGSNFVLRQNVPSPKVLEFVWLFPIFFFFFFFFFGCAIRPQKRDNSNTVMEFGVHHKLWATLTKAWLLAALSEVSNILRPAACFLEKKSRIGNFLSHFSRIGSRPKKLLRVGKKVLGHTNDFSRKKSQLLKTIKTHGNANSFSTKLSSSINWTHENSWFFFEFFLRAAFRNGQWLLEG